MGGWSQRGMREMGNSFDLFAVSMMKIKKKYFNAPSSHDILVWHSLLFYAPDEKVSTAALKGWLCQTNKL